MLPRELFLCLSRGEQVWHSRLRRGDDVRVFVSLGWDQRPFECEVRVTQVAWHGHYSIITGWRYVGRGRMPMESWWSRKSPGWRPLNGIRPLWRAVRFRLWRDSPGERGVLSCRVLVRRNPQPEPEDRTKELNEHRSVMARVRRLQVTWRERKYGSRRMQRVT